MKRNKLYGQAIELRMAGLSFGAIANQLSLSKSTVSLWLRDVEISDIIRSTLHRNVTAGLHKARSNNKILSRSKRLQYQAAGREQAKKQDCRHAMGCMLYWAEGRKSRNRVAFANTDPDMMVFFKSFLVDYYDVSTLSFTININAYASGRKEEKTIASYWLNLLNLPKTCLRRGVFKIASTPTRRKNRHLHGVCTIQVNKTAIVQQLFGAIQEYIGATKPEWVDKR